MLIVCEEVPPLNDFSWLSVSAWKGVFYLHETWSHQISTCLFTSHYLLITSLVAAVGSFEHTHSSIKGISGAILIIRNKQVVERNRHKEKNNDFRTCTKTVVSVKEWNHYIIQSLETKPPLYIVTWYKNFAHFLVETFQWLKASRANMLRGLVDNPEDQENRHIAA